MNKENDEKQEQRLRFVAKHYKEGSLDTERAWQKFASTHAIKRRMPLMRYLMQAAAVLLVLVGIGTFWMWRQSQPEWVAVSTVAGQLKDVYLPDSSLVSLAGNSSLKYDARRYGKERRAVEMKGKAFFQVKRDEARPFSVDTRLAVVQVLGTSFQVEASGKTAAVNVMTGKVSFAAADTHEEVILTAGMSARYSEEKPQIDIHTEEDANFLSWKTGLLRFTDTPLDKVMEDIASYYQVKITNGIPKQDAKLTASFSHMSLDEVLTVINQTLDVRLTSQKSK